jgi:hypothetical protein
MKHELRNLIVGLDNPQSSDPRYALYSRPSGCAGSRLLAMMRLAQPDFLERAYLNIPKTNLFPVGPVPSRDRRTMLRAAGLVLLSQLEGRGTKVVLLGTEVRDAVMRHDDRPEVDFAEYEAIYGSHYAWIPHPSGRNRLYNSREVKLAVGTFLVSFWAGGGR